MTTNHTQKKATAGREGILIALGSSLTIVGSVMVAPMIPKMAQEFGPTTPDIATLLPLTITGPALAIALFAPLAGWISDRIGRKKMLIIATLLYAILGMLPALLNDLGDIMISRLLFGCAEAVIMTCCTALIADYWHGDERLKFVNFQVIAIGLIGSIFYVIGGVLGEQSWRSAFYLYLIPLLLIPFMARILWEPVKNSNAEAMEPASSDDPTKVAKLTLIVSFLMIFGGMALNFVVPVQMPSLLVAIGVTSTTQIGLASGISLLSTLGGSLTWALWRRLFNIGGCNALLMALVGVGLWLLATATTYEQVLFAVIIQGLGAGLMVPNVIASAMQALPSKVRGRGIGGFTSCLYLGQFMSPIIVGMLMPFTKGSLTEAITLLAVISLVVAALWLLAQLFGAKAPRQTEVQPN
ncbi:MFS transporter [Marinomonas piezotolerans]|uniref:MFS-type drug efflux transporter P55 n=1 Tax=Marinomonas piezotolerans TaxID=2213058 RepID=A0A370UD06_9GAMM|nr:MFS transporter [Marinomonas piezotolerans]RDL45668.1 MFS transporter [Marinomonas piezotolerans]